MIQGRLNTLQSVYIMYISQREQVNTVDPFNEANFASGIR